MPQADPFAQYAVEKKADPFAAYATPQGETKPAPADDRIDILGALLSPLGIGRDPVKRALIGTAQYAKENPAKAGALAATMMASGGMAPGLIGVGQAALYGAAGAGGGLVAHQATTPDAAPLALGSSLGTMAKEGAIQGAAQGVGQTLAAGAQRGGRWLMNRALNLSARLSREFPQLSQTMIDEAITVSQGGLAKARTMLVSAKAKATEAIRVADAAGVKVPITAATGGLSKTLDEIGASGDIEGGLTALVRVEKQVIAGRPADLTVAQADALKTSLQRQSRNLYQAINAGNGRPGLQVMAQAKADMAAALNDAIEAATTSAGASTYRSGNAAAQQMIGATRGIRHATRPGSNLYQAMVRPGVGAMLGGAEGYREGGTAGALAGAALGAVATSPGTMSREALILSHPAMQAFLRQLPRATIAAIFRDVEAQTATAEPQP